MARPPGNKREPLMEGALRAFVALGYRGATMPKIAKEARVSPATCYLYFESKADLANALVRKWVGLVLDRMSPILDDENPSAELHMKLVRTSLLFGREHPLGYEFLFRGIHPSYLDEDSTALIATLTAKEVAAFTRYREAGLIGAISVHEVRALVRGHARFLVEAARIGSIELTDALIDRTARMSWHALACTTEFS